MPSSASSPYSIRRDRREAPPYRYATRLRPIVSRSAQRLAVEGPRLPSRVSRARSRSSDLPVARAELRSIRHENTSRAAGGDVEVEISRVVSPVPMADASIGAQNDIGGGGGSPRASASSRAATFERRPSYHAHRRTTEIRRAAGFVRPSPGFQALFEGSEPASCSMVLPANHRRGRAGATPGGAHVARTSAQLTAVV